MADNPSRLQRFSYAIEAGLLSLVWRVFGSMSAERASAITGAIARTIGPKLGVSRIARRNLAHAFPEMSPAEIEATVHGVWDNFGRVAGEFPHLSTLKVFKDPRITVEGAEYIDQLRDDGKPGIFFTAHFGNWELAAIAVTQRGIPLGVVYRAANNPAVDDFIRRGRASLPGELLPKGREAAKRGLAILSRGGHLGMLPDQKMNDGISVPFFGRQAMTAPALAQFVLRYDCPIVPIHVVREAGFRFRIVISPPLGVKRSEDRHADVENLTTEVNRVIESWVREHPDQWLWLHRRWPD